MGHTGGTLTKALTSSSIRLARFKLEYRSAKNIIMFDNSLIRSTVACVWLKLNFVLHFGPTQSLYAKAGEPSLEQRNNERCKKIIHELFLLNLISFYLEIKCVKKTKTLQPFWWSDIRLNLGIPSNVEEETLRSPRVEHWSCKTLHLSNQPVLDTLTLFQAYFHLSSLKNIKLNQPLNHTSSEVKEGDLNVNHLLKIATIMENWPKSEIWAVTKLLQVEGNSWTTVLKKLNTSCLCVLNKLNSSHIQNRLLSLSS